MAEYHIIKLKHLTPLHMGAGNENYDFSASSLQSDTLSSALAALRCLQGKTEDVKEFLDSFIISSAFPFYKENLYFPKPQGKLLSIKVEGQEEHIYRKKIKKVKYIEFGLWLKLIRGEELVIDLEQLQGEFITLSKEQLCISKCQVMQRVSVPRVEGMDAQPFFFNWQFFTPESGLFCLVDTDDETFEEIKQLFVMLGEEGIGSDKNIGGGKFEVEMGKLVIPESKEAGFTLLLSVYLPSKAELPVLNLSQAHYNLVLRGGFMAGSSENKLRHLRKRAVYMFDSGSMFPCISPLNGRIVNLAPEWNDSCMHPVYRSGKPLCIPIKL